MIECEFPWGGKAKLRHVAVDTILNKDGKILLVKRAERLLEGGKWTLPGGYMDRDEGAVEAAKRETMEESGWETSELELFRINDRTDRKSDDLQNLLLIFIGQPVKKSGEVDDETTEQKWFELDKLPPDEQIAFDHAETIKLYKKYLKEKFELPILG